MRARLSSLIAPFVGLSLFLLALWVLHHTLAEYHYQDIVDYLRSLSLSRLLLAASLTVLGYLAMSAYDWLALRYVRRTLSWQRTLFASFLSYAFSNTIGLSVLASGSIRYRLYSAWGLSALEIAKVVLFGSITLWLGMLSCAGGVLLLDPPQLPAAWEVINRYQLALGLGLLLIPLGWCVLGWIRRQPFHIRNWELPVVRPKLAGLQIIAGSVDWLLAGAVFYLLLPDAELISFGHFLSVFLLAQLLALISHVPGGLGVFESVVVTLLAPDLAAGDVFAGLLMFRLCYYLIPLLVATLALAIYEAKRLRQHVGALAKSIEPWLPVVLPQLFAFLTLLAGALLLFSVSTPAVEERLNWLADMIPLPVLEASHLLGSLIGVALLLLARGLQRRLDAAWLLTVILLAAGIISTLLKGVDYEEASVLALLLLLLLPCHRHFYRRSSLLVNRFTPSWLLTISLLACSAVWLGFFSYRHVEYSNALWWQFSFGSEGEAPRFLRALVGGTGLLILYALMYFLRPQQPQQRLPTSDELQQITSWVRDYPYTYAYLALVGDKSLLYNAQQTPGLVMYGIESRAWIAMGDPVAPTLEQRRELAWQFRELCEQYDGWPVFYQVRHDHLDIYLELGLTLLKIGEEACVDLATFHLEGKARANLRQNLRKLEEREHYRFELRPAGASNELLDELRSVSDAWLALKHTREKSFSLGRFDADYLARSPLALVWRGEQLVAFANVWSGDGELSVDLMRHQPGAPSGTMDYLFTKLMLWGQQNGYQRFNLGMAPLAGLHSRSLAPLWNRFGALVFGRGERFYNFRGVRQYKDKFGPRWEPRYLALPGGSALPRVLIHLTALISGGLQGTVHK